MAMSRPETAQVNVPSGGEASAISQLVEIKRVEKQKLEIQIGNLSAQINSARLQWDNELANSKQDWAKQKAEEMEKLAVLRNQADHYLKMAQNSLLSQEQNERESMQVRLKLGEQEQVQTDLNAERLEIARMRRETADEKEYRDSIVRRAQEELRVAGGMVADADKQLAEARRLFAENAAILDSVQKQQAALDSDRKQYEIVRKEVESRIAVLESLEVKQAPQLESVSLISKQEESIDVKSG